MCLSDRYVGRLSICITCPDGSSQVLPFSVKELVVLDTLLDHGAQMSTLNDPTGLQQQRIIESNKQLPKAQQFAPDLLKSLPSSSDEELIQQIKRPNTRKIASKMIASGTFKSLADSSDNLPESKFCCSQDGWI